MDIVREISQVLGVDIPKAEAVAGSIFTTMVGSVRDRHGELPARDLEEALPDLPRWCEQTRRFTEQESDPDVVQGGLEGWLGDLPERGLTQLLGHTPGGSAGLGALIGRLGVKPSLFPRLAPPLGHYLRARLSPELLEQVSNAVPMLGGELKKQAILERSAPRGGPPPR